MTDLFLSGRVWLTWVPCFRGPFPLEKTIPTTAKACLDVIQTG